MVRKKEGICHLMPLDWSPDANGHWPRVEYIVEKLPAPCRCPSCNEDILFNEIEYVFGVCRRDKKDIIFLLRCLHCRLPMRIRVRNFLSRHEQLVEDMQGWAGWEARQQEFEAEEEKLYGKPEGESERNAGGLPTSEQDVPVD